MNEELNPKNLKEGEDFYYSPEGFRIFTEKYHLKRDKKTNTIRKWDNYLFRKLDNLKIILWTNKQISE